MIQQANRNRCATIFCANCGNPVILEVPLKDAREMRKKNVQMHCALCKPLAQEIDTLVARYKDVKKKLENLRAHLLISKEEQQLN